jgi:amidophosphoribosyltransferase
MAGNEIIMEESALPISSPPIVSPCFYRIDTPTKRELIGSIHTTQEIKKYITADSLAYLSLEGMLNASPGHPRHYCTACFTEQYPIPFTKAEELQLGLFEATHH